MKNFRFSILAFVVLGLASCSGDDDSAPTETSIIVGEWQLEEMDYSGVSTVNYEETSMSTSFTGELMESDARVTFHNNNTWTSGGNYTIRLTSTMDGMTDVEEIPISNFSGSGSYSVQGNILTVEETENNLEDPSNLSPMGINEAVISELTPERLVLTFDYNEVTSVNGMEIEITMEGFQIFTR